MQGWKPDTAASFLSVVLACFFSPLFAHTLSHVFIWGDGERESSFCAWHCMRLCKRGDETKNYRAVGYYEGEYYEDNERQVRGRCSKERKYYDPLFRERNFEIKYLTTAQLLSLYENENGKDNFFGDTVRINSENIPLKLKDAPDDDKGNTNKTIQPYWAPTNVDPMMQELARKVQEKIMALAIKRSRTRKTDYTVSWIAMTNTFCIYLNTRKLCDHSCARMLDCF